MNGGRGVWALVLVVAGCAGCNGAFKFDEPPAGDGGDVTDGTVDGGPPTPGACTSDATCGGLHCHLPSGTCVACTSDAECGAPRPRCEPKLHVCVACLNGPDCKSRQGCDTVTNRCLDTCFDEDDCKTPGFVCDRDRTLCIECKTSANCAGSPNGPICDVPIGRCVACAGGADCAAPTAICDRRTGKCAACVSTSACAAPAVCDPGTLVCRAP